MERKKRLLYLAGFGLLLFILSLSARVESVSGVVISHSQQPISGATVKLKTTEFVTYSDNDGHFELDGFIPAFRIHLTAWKDGHYVGGTKVYPWDKNIEIEIQPYFVQDNLDYSWILPIVETRSATQEWITQTSLSIAAKLSFNQIFLPIAERLTLGCRDCHAATIYDQWNASSHALGANNPIVLSMYNGTDLLGNQSPPTRSVINREYGSIPLPPDTTQPYYGPGYKLDFPDTTGNCATCHLPTAALADPYGTDLNKAVGVDELGIHCDFCHKIVDVRLDPTTGQPPENMSGILAIELMRPSDERQLFFGPYDDVDVGPDTFLPLMKQSEICAPCHNASFWNVPIYQSFAEWQASSYPADGKSCQSCHMTPDGVTTNFAPARGGLERDPDTIPSHNYPGATDEALLQNAVSMDVSARNESGQVEISVTILNDKTGHHVPTDSPLRQMILIIQATDDEGTPLKQLDGPILPQWTGEGNPSQGYYAGLPGMAYAKLLKELWTEIYPSGAYWNPTLLVSDNRIAAGESDTTTYTFAAPVSGRINIDARLLFRRAFIDLIDQKGWSAPDIVMEEQVLFLDARE